MFPVYALCAVITAVIANAVMKANDYGMDEGDRLIMSALLGMVFPFTIVGLIIHLGGEKTQELIEARQNDTE